MTKKLTPGGRRLFTFFVLLVLVYGGAQMVMRPLQQYDEMVDYQIRLRSKELEEKHNHWLGVSVLAQKYRLYDNVLHQQQSDEEQMRSLVNVVQQAASQAGINLQNFQPLKIGSQENLKRFSIQMTIEGTWESMSAFLHVLQDQPQYIILDELTLERASTGASVIRGRILISQMRLVHS